MAIRIAGASSGRVTLRNSCSGEAPSARPASYRSFGIASRAA